MARSIPRVGEAHGSIRRSRTIPLLWHYLVNSFPLTYVPKPGIEVANNVKDPVSPKGCHTWSLQWPIKWRTWFIQSKLVTAGESRRHIPSLLGYDSLSLAYCDWSKQITSTVDTFKVIYNSWLGHGSIDPFHPTHVQLKLPFYPVVGIDRVSYPFIWCYSYTLMTFCRSICVTLVHFNF